MDLVPPSGDDRPHANASARLWLRLVGEFEAVGRNGVSAAPISKKARALLALVAAHMPQPIRRDFAASLLWSGKPREHAANSLRQALRELQIALSICGDPPVLLAGGGRLSLQADRVWVDIHDPAAIRWKQSGDGAVGPLLLCQNLQGLDPAFDSHLERLWKNLVFHQAFAAKEHDEEQSHDTLQGPPPLTGQEEQEATAEPPQPLRARTLNDESAPGWRIAVLPFRSLGSPLEGGLSLGMAEEISAALARFRMPRLIATGSFWDGLGPSADALARCRAYNLDYVISGTIQTSGSRVRVTVTLLDVAMDFEVIWASRFEGTTADLFTLQDTIASQTVAQIDPELLQRQQYITADTIQAPSAAAHQAVMAAIQGIYRPDRDRFMAANDLLEQAIALDGNYAAAYAWQAYWYVIGVSQGWIASPGDAVEKAGIAAEKAIELDPLDARGLTIAGHVKAYILHDVEASLALQERALALNPNLPIAWSLSSWAHIYNGSHKTAIEHALMAEALSPTDPHVFLMEHAAMTARFFLRELDVADAIAVSALERRPRHGTALRIRLAVLGHLGRKEEANAVIETLRALNQKIEVDKMILPPLRSADREYFAEGLRLAGVQL